MAALSRCSRFLLSRALCTPKRLALTKCLRNDNKILQSCTSVPQSHLRFLVSTGVDINSPQESTSRPDVKYKDCFHDLEMWLYKYRQVSSFNLRLCMEKFEKHGIEYSQDGLMVLKATGEPLCEYHPDKRMALTNQVWEYIKSSGCKLGTSHFNALLTVYLENEHKFSPPDIIEQMENSGVIPNRVTFQLLIAAYCESGDLEKASQILEHMKDHNIPLTDTVFNHLIRGHFKIKDPEGAQSMVDLMKQSGLETTSSTYGTLIEGYAEMGDLDSINKVFSEAEENQDIIQCYHLVDSIFSAYVSGNDHIVEQIIQRMKDSGKSYHGPLRRTVVKLASHGHVDAAYKLFTDNFDNTDVLRSIQRTVVINLDTEKYGDKLKTLIDDSRDTCQSLLKIASNEGRVDWIVMLLQTYREHLSKPVSSLFNVILELVKTGDADELLKLESATTHDDGSADQYLMRKFVPKFVVPVLAKSDQPIDRLCANLKDKGYEVLASTLENTWLFNNDTDKAIEHGKNNPMILNNAVCDAISRNADFKNQWEGILQVLKKSPRYYSSKTFLLEKVLKENPEKAIDIVKYCKSEKINLDTVAKDTLKELGQLDEAFKEGIFKGTQSPRMDFATLSVEELQSFVRKNPNSIAPRIKLLGKLLFEKKVEEAIEVLKSLDDLHKDTTLPSFFANVDGLKIYSLHRKDLQQALKYLSNIEKLEEEGMVGRVHCNTFYHTLGLMVDEGKLEDTIPHIKHFVKHHADFTKPGYVSIQAVTLPLSRTLKPAEAFEFVQRLITLQFIHPDNKRFWVKALFDEYSKRCDSDELVEMCKDMSKKKLITSLFNAMNLLIEKEDEKCLQEIVDFFIPIYGEVPVLLNLMCGLVYKNKLTQARAVAKLPGLWGDMKVINYCANGFVQDKKVKELEELVELTRDIDGCKRDVMLEKLIKGYVMARDFQAAKDVLSKFKEEDIIPSAEILEFLADRLKANGVEVDFYVPSGTSDKVEKTERQKAKTQANVQGSSNLLSEVKEIVSLFKSNGNYEEYLRNLFDGDLLQSDRSKRKLLNQLQEQLSREDLRKLVYWLYSSGKSDMIGLIRKDDAPFSLLALEVMNRCPADLVEMLQTVQGGEIQKYITLSLLSNLRKTSPEDFETVANLIRSHGANGGSAVGLLWLQHVTDHEFDRATAVLEDLPERIKSDLLKSMKVYSVCRKEVKQENDDVLLYLVGVMKDFETTSKKLFSNLLELYTKQQNIEKTKGIMTRLQEEGHQFAQIPPSIRKAVESLYQQHGLSIPAEMVQPSSSSEQNGQSTVEQVSHEAR